MFKLGNSEDLWSCRERYPEIFLEAFKRHSLKPLGHATVCEYINRKFIQTERSYRVLEIGHGASSPFFALFNSSEKIKCYGIDDNDKDKTVSVAGLNKLRASYPNVEFHSGYLGGNTGNDLPSDFFDLVFSVSVIEHVPAEQLPDFHKDIFCILRPGGVQIHSYDRPWGGDVRLMKKIIEDKCFEWLEAPRIDMENFWKLDTHELSRVVFEHPFNVMELFMQSFPREGRILYNWVTVLVGARKPE
ncbi:MAG: methyltransferase domain-containing protein [Gallionella sp.]